jgi:hypothetical protein
MKQPKGTFRALIRTFVADYLDVNTPQTQFKEEELFRKVLIAYRKEGINSEHYIEELIRTEVEQEVERRAKPIIKPAVQMSIEETFTPQLLQQQIIRLGQGNRIVAKFATYAHWVTWQNNKLRHIQEAVEQSRVPQFFLESKVGEYMSTRPRMTTEQAMQKLGVEGWD